MVTIPSWIPRTHEQWVLMVLLFKRAMFAAQRRAVRMMAATDATPTDLRELADGGWIIPSRDGKKRIDVREEPDWWTGYSYDLDTVVLSLSAEGLNWVTHSRLTVALFAIAERPASRRGVPLSDLAAYDVAQDTIAWLAEKGLITVHTPQGSTPVAPALLIGHGQLPDVWTVKLTKRGLQIICRP